jgi:hypothetical protein
MSFLNSDEFRTGMGPRLTAFLLYSCLLMRDATEDERNGMATMVAGGTDIRQLMDLLINSAEFEALLK